MRMNGGMTTGKGMKKGMSRKTVKILVAFVLGQLVQIICHVVSMNFWDSQRIPFCAAGGFLVAVAVFAGAWISRQNEEPRHKSYKEWAEVPGVDDADIEVLP